MNVWMAALALVLAAGSFVMMTIVMEAHFKWMATRSSSMTRHQEIYMSAANEYHQNIEQGLSHMNQVMITREKLSLEVEEIVRKCIEEVLSND